MKKLTHSQLDPLAQGRWRSVRCQRYFGHLQSCSLVGWGGGGKAEGVGWGLLSEGLSVLSIPIVYHFRNVIYNSSLLRKRGAPSLSKSQCLPARHTLTNSSTHPSGPQMAEYPKHSQTTRKAAGTNCSSPRIQCWVQT